MTSPSLKVVVPALLAGVGVAAAPMSHAAPTTAKAPAKTSKMTPKTAETTMKHWWPAAVDTALARSGTNRPQLVMALQQVPAAQRPGLQFLLENMPDADLKTLSATYLLGNTNIAYQALNSAPWKAKVPQDIFLNNVLPYASLNEARDNSRADLRAKSLPLIAGSKTIGEAAQKINAKLFPLVNVKYSTERQRADQNPTQSMGSGLASCSGLAILLVDACRAVGIPARVTGTPMWANGRGNHTWVEIWDGDWHFVGAAEPDEKGLDHAWFTGDAAQARKDSRENAIYSTSFKKTGVTFPLVWAPNNTSVNAVNVTDRYAQAPVAGAPANGAPAVAPAATTTKLLISVLDENGKRSKRKIIVIDTDTKAIVFRGETTDETADMNNFLSFDAQRNHSYLVAALIGDKGVATPLQSGTDAEQKVVIDLRQAAAQAAQNAPKSELLPAGPKVILPAPPAPQVVKPLAPTLNAQLQKVFTDYFTAPAEQRATWKFAPAMEKLLQANEPAVRQAAWDAYRAAPIHTAEKTDYDAHQVRFGQYLSPYTLKTVGTRPANGWPLFIAMHGGGNAPKELNDSQWKIMQSYYTDHPELGGYQYLALRAPNDTWNGFYDDYVYPLVGNLIQSAVLFGDVDPNKVFIMGYSHGGYGAFAIGPKTPDRFAGVHAAAGAPTDGETSAKTLRNTYFTSMVGEKDLAYDRLSRDRKFADQIAQLRGARTDIYPVTVQVMLGFEHSNLPNHEQIPDLYPHVRNTIPHELTWEQTDGVITDFFWLHSDDPAKKKEIDATLMGNTITVTTTPDVTKASLMLDTRLVDFSKPITLDVNGKKTTQIVTPQLRTLCKTLMRRGDPNLAFSAQVALPLAK